jgi:hypothetical protein
LRTNFFNILGLTDSTATCWLTGEVGYVQVAHIIPDSARKLVLDRLGLETNFKNSLDLSQPLNLMILRSDDEEAFDRLELTFVAKDLLHTSTFILKIWDESVRADPFGRYEGSVLNVPA